MMWVLCLMIVLWMMLMVLINLFGYFFWLLSLNIVMILLLRLVLVSSGRNFFQFGWLRLVDSFGSLFLFSVELLSSSMLQVRKFVSVVWLILIGVLVRLLSFFVICLVISWVWLVLVLKKMLIWVMVFFQVLIGFFWVSFFGRQLIGLLSRLLGLVLKWMRQIFLFLFIFVMLK